jgi:hypothetical protein
MLREIYQPCTRTKIQGVLDNTLYRPEVEQLTSERVREARVIVPE